MFKTSLTYDDITFVPREASRVVSRSEPDTTINVRNKTKLTIPLTAAPMIHVCDSEMAEALAKLGSVGFIHRFQTIDSQTKSLTNAIKNTINYVRRVDYFYNFGVAINITGDFIDRLNSLVQGFLKERGENKNFKLWVVLDTANGFSTLMLEALMDVIGYLKTNNIDMNDIILVAGNVAGGEGYQYLAEQSDYLLDVVRVGISNGSVCTTGIVTGVGQGIVTTIMECEKIRFESSNDMPLIMADGGIRSSGDIAKALAVGADMVMAGSLFAGFDESPGEFHVDTNDLNNWILMKSRQSKIFGEKIEYNAEDVIDEYVDQLKKVDPSKLYKKYMGMASYEAAVVNNNINNVNKQIIAEGESHYVVYKGSVYDYIPALKGGLRSSMSYMNSLSIEEFKDTFWRIPDSIVQLTYFGHIERQPFIKNNGVNIS